MRRSTPTLMAAFERTLRREYEGLVLTSIDVQKVNGNTVRFNGSIRGEANDKTATFLKNVREINKDQGWWRRIGSVFDSGERIFEAETVTVEDAKEIMDKNSSDGKGQPLFCVHGFNVEPGDHLDNMKTQSNKFDQGKFTLVPVIWPSEGGLAEYDTDRRRNAAGAANAFKTLKQGVDSFPSSSLLCHSMANRVLRDFADEGFQFDNIFMAAADVRYDLFHENYIEGGVRESERGDGLRICKMLSGYPNNKGKVHVLHNNLDHALIAARINPFSSFNFKRIGQEGHNMDLTHTEINNKNKKTIENFDCSPQLPLNRTAAHSYQFDDFAVDYYQENHIGIDEKE